MDGRAVLIVRALLFGSLTLALTSWPSLAAPAPPLAADSRAQTLAASLPRVKELHARLKSEIALISDPRLRREALDILERPEFGVVRARKTSEPEILAALKRAELLDEGVAAIFPPLPEMPFIAASGSPWQGHHTYPGGLVYHTLANLLIGLSYARVYDEVYGVSLDLDLIRLAALWHDAAKTITIHWNPDGSATQDEGRLAGTGAHHLWGIAEAVHRGYPPLLVTAIASAHHPPGKSHDALLGFLKAAAIIAGKPYEAAGLSSDGRRLAGPAPIEAFVNHLDDHDFVTTEVSQATTAEAIDAELRDAGSPEHERLWTRHETMAREGDLAIYHRLLGATRQ